MYIRNNWSLTPIKHKYFNKISYERVTNDVSECHRKFNPEIDECEWNECLRQASEDQMWRMDENFDEYIDKLDKNPWKESVFCPTVFSSPKPK